MCPKLMWSSTSSRPPGAGIYQSWCVSPSGIGNQSKTFRAVRTAIDPEHGSKTTPRDCSGRAGARWRRVCFRLGVLLRHPFISHQPWNWNVLAYRRRHSVSFIPNTLAGDRSCVPGCGFGYVGPEHIQSLRSRIALRKATRAGHHLSSNCCWGRPALCRIRLCLRPSSSTRPSPARAVVLQSRSKCQPMPASISTTAQAAGRS